MDEIIHRADFTKPAECAQQKSDRRLVDRGTLYLLIRGDYKKALDYLTEALILSPSNATALARRGEAFEGLGQVDHALEDFQAELRLNQDLKSAKEDVWRLSRRSDESKAGGTKN